MAPEIGLVAEVNVQETAGGPCPGDNVCGDGDCSCDGDCMYCLGDR